MYQLPGKEQSDGYEDKITGREERICGYVKIMILHIIEVNNRHKILEVYYYEFIDVP